MRTHENRGYAPDCPHHPAVPRTIEYTCVCCHRTWSEQAETYALRSCASCRCIMQITVVEEGKVVTVSREKLRALAKRTPLVHHRVVGQSLW